MHNSDMSETSANGNRIQKRYGCTSAVATEIAMKKADDASMYALATASAPAIFPLKYYKMVDQLKKTCLLQDQMQDGYLAYSLTKECPDDP